MSIPSDSICKVFEIGRNGLCKLEEKNAIDEGSRRNLRKMKPFTSETVTFLFGFGPHLAVLMDNMGY